MKTLRTMLAILCVFTLGARVFDATRAAAATDATLLTRPDPAPPGGRVEAIGTGFCAAPCSPVTLRVGGEAIAEHVRVDAGGNFSATFNAPFAAGSYTLRAIQTKGGTTLEGDADFTVGTTDVILSGPGAAVAPLTANESPRTTTPPPTSPPLSTTTVTGGPTTRPPATTRSSTSTTRLSTSTTTAITEPSVPDATSSSTSAWPWVLAGLAALVAAAAAAALWYRARRRRNG